MYHHLDTTKKSFIGKKIKNVKREYDAGVIISFSDGTECVLEVVGDCCSSSIFYEIETPENYQGAELLDILEDDGGQEEEGVALPKIKNLFPDFYLEELSIWNVVFRTNKGDILFKHINSSNGYYNGMTTYISRES